MIWSVAQTESTRERTAQRFLGAAKFETYLPLIGAKRRNVPLFPGYIFVRLGDTGWSQVDNTAGVMHLLRSSELRPARIDDQIIDSIRAQEKNGVVRLPEKAPKWHMGDRVRVGAGSFLGQIGLFDGMAPHERVYVLLDLFGRKTRTALAMTEIQDLELARTVR